jgi:hypothetical protein
MNRTCESESAMVTGQRALQGARLFALDNCRSIDLNRRRIDHLMDERARHDETRRLVETMAGQLETMTHRVERLERRLREERRSRRSVRGTDTSGSRTRVEGRWSPSPVRPRAGPSCRVEVQNLTGFVGDGSEDRPFQLVEVEPVRRFPSIPVLPRRDPEDVDPVPPFEHPPSYMPAPDSVDLPDYEE